MGETPLLTVAIPTYNGSRHLADALRGILAQGGVSFDLIISDDRSDDETLAVVRAEAGDRARVSVNPERLGLAGNWNRCVALSRTPWVAIFHQDDVMRPGHLAAHVSTIQSDASLGLIVSGADVIDAEGREVLPSVVDRGDLGPQDRTYVPGAFVAELAATNPVRCSGVTLRAEAHAAVGGFDPSYRYVVDWEFWLRVARDWGVAWLARPTVALRWHPASETHRFKSGTTDLDEASRLLTDLYNHDGANLPDARRLRRTADRRLARAFLNRAHDSLRGGDPALARRCLYRALGIWPGILKTIALDPKLTARMGALAVLPDGIAGRWLAGRPGSPADPIK